MEAMPAAERTLLATLALLGYAVVAPDDLGRSGGATQSQLTRVPRAPLWLSSSSSLAPINVLYASYCVDSLSSSSLAKEHTA